MKYILIIIIVVAVIFAADFFARREIYSNIPPSLLPKLEELKTNVLLMDSIGGFVRYEYSYNENDVKFKDSIRFTIKIYGNDKTLIYQAIDTRISKDQWELVTQKTIIE